MKTLIQNRILRGLFPCVIAIVAVCVIHAVVFLGDPITTDENSYVFQAYNFLDGVIARPFPPVPGSFFHEMIILDEKAGWLSRYPPGHPLWLLLGCALGYSHLMVALAAGLALWLIGRSAVLLGQPALRVLQNSCGRKGLRPSMNENTRFFLNMEGANSLAPSESAISQKSKPALPTCFANMLGQGYGIAAFLLLCSPFFLFTYGTLLSHTSGLLASSLLLFNYIRWKKSGAIRFAVIAGLSLGWLFLNRTYTATLIALPFGVDAVFTLFRRRGDKQILWGVIFFVLSSVLCAALLFLYNYLAVGNAATMTYLFYAPSENLGFGLRHTQGVPIDHTFANGITYLFRNINLLDQWLFGFRGSLIIAAIFLILGWTSGWTPLLLASAVLVWIGQIFFWYPGSHETGPGYYFETLPFIVVMIVQGVRKAFAWLDSFPQLQKPVAILAALFLVVSAGRFMVQKGRELRNDSYELSQLLDCVNQAPRNALIFPDFHKYTKMRHGLLIFNPRGLDSQPLKARTLYHGDRNLLINVFSNRTPYRLTTDRNPKLIPLNPAVEYGYTFTARLLHARTGELVAGPAKHRSSEDALAGASITNEATMDRPALRREAKAGRDAPDWFAFGPDAWAYPGRFIVEYDIIITNCPPDQVAVTLDAATDHGRRALASREIQGNTSENKEVLMFSVDKCVSVEPRVYYHGIGDVTFYGLTVLEAH